MKTPIKTTPPASRWRLTPERDAEIQAIFEGKPMKAPIKTPLPASKWSHPNGDFSAENTDRELWRGPDEGNGDYYADSIFITKEGALGINCGGSVHVRSIREWHRLAGGPIEEIPRS